MPRPKRKLLIFDLDDTLLDTSDVFYQIRLRFLGFLSERGILLESCTFEEYDLCNMKLFGYAPWRYAFTMTEVYLDLVRADELCFSSEDLKAILEIGNQVERTIPSLRTGVRELFTRLSDAYQLAVLTRGNRSLQMQKLQYYKLDRVFSHISIVDRKTTSSFQRILDSLSVTPRMAWSIGDSPKWDILPAQEAGLRTILVKYEHPDFDWGHEERNLSAHDTLAVDDLLEIPNLLEGDHELSFERE